MNENKSILNSFFANFDSLYCDMDNPKVSSLLEKIKVFPKDILDFNSIFFKIMPRYFFSISGDEVSMGKPNPEILLKAAEKISLRPEDCLVIEDARNGVTAAKSAGMKCIGYLNPNSGNQYLSQADLIIHSYDELSMGVLKNLFS